jgi:hypothetical protein
MNDGPNIQHKAAHTGEPGFAFEAGQRVPIVEPEIFSTHEPPEDSSRQADPRRILSAEFLLSVIVTKAIAQKGTGEETALLLAFDCKCAGAPKTSRELGTLLGCSHVAALARLTRLKAEFAREFGKSTPASLTDPPLVKRD